MGRIATLAVCTLNQWALDFEGNLRRILESVKRAKEGGATFRCGPELEICGYSCEDHFFEGDTLLHSWEVLAQLLDDPICSDIIIDVGMPVMHKDLIYNCRVVFFNKKIVLIRPKLLMCDTGNYRESRWFSPWRKLNVVETLFLPQMIARITKQSSVPFGDAVIATHDTCIGFEVCEELWSPQSTHVPLAIDGVEIIVNGSASYTELRKSHYLIDLIRMVTVKCGGCYLYSNLRGGDGTRLYFNGSSCIALNGQILKYDRQFSLAEVQVECASIDLEEIRSYRNNIRTRSAHSNNQQSYSRLLIDFSLSSCHERIVHRTLPCEWSPPTPEEEIALGPACWLWDYLRRSNQGGFFLPLSGGIDSASTACIVFSMCRLIVDACQSGDTNVQTAIRKIVDDPSYTPVEAKELCGRIFVTCYMATENSSSETKLRAGRLASQIGSHHLGIVIDLAVSAIISIFTTVTGRTPRFTVHGGSHRENLALQNIQARLRMVLSYLFGQLMLWVRGKPGALLVLGSGNVDEALRGYMTKYDCSSADLNPIGSICKTDLKKFLHYAKDRFNLDALDGILSATPTAELAPLEDGRITQTDEEEMGMTYDELNVYGQYRKKYYCGPYSMFDKLVDVWATKYSPAETAEKVKHFFRMYAINRHKMTTLTPSYHCEYYSPDDNRFDHRPFLYDASWPWQFRAIDQSVSKLPTNDSS